MQAEYDRCMHWFNGCNTPARSGEGPRRAVYLFGDSHASTVAPAVMAAFDGAASVVWSAAGFSCGYLSMELDEFVREIRNQDDGWKKDACEEACRCFNNAADAALEQTLEPCDVVIICNHHLKFANNMDQVRAQQERLRTLQAIVERKGAHLVFLGDVPGVQQQATMCSASSAMAASCERSLDLIQQEFAHERLIYTEVASGHSSTFYIPVYELLCTADKCGVYIPGTTTVAYADTDHLTNAGAMYLWPFIAAFFVEHGLMA